MLVHLPVSEYFGEDVEELAEKLTPSEARRYLFIRTVLNDKELSKLSSVDETSEEYGSRKHVKQEKQNLNEVEKLYRSECQNRVMQLSKPRPFHKPISFNQIRFEGRNIVCSSSN